MAQFLLLEAQLEGMETRLKRRETELMSLIEEVHCDTMHHDITLSSLTSK
jgi:hypothetical protein